MNLEQRFTNANTAELKDMPKPTPRYWWDFTDDCEHVIVQSDYPGGDKLGRFKTSCSGIEQAENLISDFESGRKTPKWSRNAKI